MRALIDTCVVIDALQDREGFGEEAEKIFLAVANQRYVGFLTAKSVTDIYYLVQRYTHSDRDTRIILNTLFHLFELIDTTGMDCMRALSLDVSDYEDAVMMESAVRVGVECIVTRNIKDYNKSPVPVYTPSDFLKLLQKQEENIYPQRGEHPCQDT